MTTLQGKLAPHESTKESEALERNHQTSMTTYFTNKFDDQHAFVEDEGSFEVWWSLSRRSTVKNIAHGPSRQGWYWNIHSIIPSRDQIAFLLEIPIPKINQLILWSDPPSPWAKYTYIIEFVLWLGTGDVWSSESSKVKVHHGHNQMYQQYTPVQIISQSHL